MNARPALAPQLFGIVCLVGQSIDGHNGPANLD